MTVLIAIVGLGVLVLVHELGHFTAAIVVGMRPRRFYVGFPPAIWKTRRNDIEYGIGSIPLGGFVKIPGMQRPAASDVDVHFGRAIDESPALERPAGELREALDAGDLERCPALLGELAAAVEARDLSPAARRGAAKGLAELEDGLGADAYWKGRLWKRLLVIGAGPAANIALAIILFAVLFATGGGKATTTVDQISSGSPAATVGLRPGDTILMINGVAVEPGDISPTISASNGKPLRVSVRRGEAIRELGPVSAKLTDGRYRLGFQLRGERIGPIESVREAFRVTGIVTKEILSSLARVVTGDGRKDISSPVGIVQGSADAASQGADSYLWVLGLISLSIALLNLLPLLPLDGGHIAVALIEAIRGKSLRREVVERVSVVGIALVMLLFFIGLSNDIDRLS